jgi:hypothetical protein
MLTRPTRSSQGIFRPLVFSPVSEPVVFGLVGSVSSDYYGKKIIEKPGSDPESRILFSSKITLENRK